MKYKNKQGIILDCEICKKNFAHLGSHIYHAHKITAKEYKTEYNLPYNMALISKEIYLKKSDHFEENREHYLNNFIAQGKKFHFKKGCSGHRRISEYEMKKITDRIKEVNSKKTTPEQCIVCKMKFNHIESHLFNAHGLIKVIHTK